MDGTVRDTLLAKISSIMEAVNNQNMKEVKGLEERLYGLEQLLFGARKIMQEQGDMAQVGVGHMQIERHGSGRGCVLRSWPLDLRGGGGYAFCAKNWIVQ